MSNAKKIPGTVEAWEQGGLGEDEAHAVVAPDESAALDRALGLQAVSIRLQKSLISDFKFLAEEHGMGYQPLMREALRRFAEAEMKRLAVKYANERRRGAAAQGDSKPKRPKAA
ncbi:hypothetical protein D3C86_1701780 [compost metagenome]